MHTPRTMVRRVATGVLAAAALVVAATPAHAQAAELSITRYDIREGTAQRWYLTCTPDEGTHPSPVAACDRLDEIGGDLDRIRFRPDVACPRIYDPVRVEITGDYHGELKIFQETYPNACFVEKLAGPIVP
ncbi:hypothetical protein ITP53_12325 [Nonomuraea sp. K274]|uniref:Subtilisin inhibitor domain-containing protein n=1 Tax=Nonomuraea cypriaca TaxID=1187855 RepID=A0A931ABY5_9ACTN|nr:SSI family serine proteinase inhibitor [Nonomuraea cypriaca]MBF8186512.1 hypothetical protein [Nonomuraea cypriaca]